MDNIEEFKTNLILQLQSEAMLDNISEREAFVNYVSERMLDAGEIQESIQYLHYEGVGKNRRTLQIDGYCVDDLSSSLILFVVDYLSGSEITLTTTDIVKFYKRAEGYLENIDYILEVGEESSGGYQLASSIKSEYAQYDNYKIYFITDRNLSMSVSDFAISEINRHKVEHYVWDITHIARIANSEKGREPITIDMTRYTSDGKGLPCILANKTADYTAYLCIIPGRTLAEIYNTYGGKLLEGNVRSFLQLRGKVNAGIRRTILNEPDNFFTYNNGIAGTAEAIETNVNSNGIGYITSIKDFQIVNGGQTTAALATCLLKDKRENVDEKINKIVVQMKLSVVSDEEKSQKLIPLISQYTNSQNAVKNTDMWSNHPLHLRLEAISRKLVAPAHSGKAYGTFWYYERTRGQYQQETYKLTRKSEKNKFLEFNPKSQLLTKTQLGILVNVMNLHPEYASLGGEKSFNKFMDFAVAKWNSSDTYFNDEFYRTVVAVQLLFKCAHDYAGSKKYEYKANVVEYTLARLFYELQTNPEYSKFSIDYEVIWRNQKISDVVASQLASIVEIAYAYLTDPERDVINVTEWAKREKCWNRFKEVPIVLNRDFLAELDTIANVKSAHDSARKDLRERKTDDAMLEVGKYGVAGFKKLVEWDKLEHVLSPDEQSLINVALGMARGKFPTDRQCKRIVEILDRARSKGYLG